MPNQTVYEFRSATVTKTAGSNVPLFGGGNVISICDSPVFSKKPIDEWSGSNPDGLGCARGLRTAFLFEAGMILMVYGIWHFWHLAHWAR